MYVASLVQNVQGKDVDSLIQTIFFSIYGNQFENREEIFLLRVFQYVLSAQFENSTDTGSPVRSNSPISRMLGIYLLRGPGHSYLRRIISSLIDDVLSHPDMDLEINVPILENGKNSKNKSGISQEEMDKRVRTLQQMVSMFLWRVTTSEDQIPFGIRFISKQIQILARRKYPDASYARICSIIGGFFFLRFINPAVVCPQASLISDREMSDKARRNLVLIAKILQTLSNNQNTAKESYMQPFDKYIEDNQDAVNRFLINICDVGDIYDQLELHKILGLCGKRMSISISIGELFNLHRILVENIEKIVRIFHQSQVINPYRLH